MIAFKGYSISESSLKEGDALTADVGIFVAGWERRFDHSIRKLQLKLNLAIVLNFEDDELPYEMIEDTERVLQRTSKQTACITLPAANSRSEWNGSIDRLLEDSQLIKARSLIVDYSCMPKSITQTIFRAIVRKGLFAKSTWLYSLGIYSDVENNTSFAQGVREFYPIRHTPGDGGMSSKRVAIVAIGGDEGLVVEYLEHYNFDRIFCICGESASSDNLTVGIGKIVKRLSFENRLSPEDIVTCDAASVIGCIERMQEIITGLDHSTSVEIFCTGPKSHAVAACIVAERYPSVRLMGRDALRYSRHDVKAQGAISRVEFIDYSNPNVRFVI